MSASAAHALPEAGTPVEAQDSAPLLIAWFMALAIMAASIVPLGILAIRDGVLVDNDDAMRLVQIREWMDGKGWFDLNETRVDPPHGMVSHWPRLIEVPIAGGILAANLFTDRDLAERIVVAVWPTVLLAALAFGLLALARRLVAPPILIAGAAIIALNPLLEFQLTPGRIDHHGVQMLLTLLLLFATVKALVDRSRFAAIAAGVIGALQLAIGLETLPLVAAAATLFGLAWIIQGDRSKRPVGTFGVSLALAGLLLFPATVAPQHWTLTACDVYSPPWLWLALGGGLGLAGLAFIKAPARLVHRVAWALSAGVAAVAVFVAYWPHCLLGPLADVDPLVKQFWLSEVGEAKPIVSLVRENPGFLFFLVFPLVGWLALAFAAYRERQSKPDYAVVFGFGTVGLALAMIAMRGVPFASIFALYGWLYLVDRILGPVLTRGIAAQPAFLRSALVLVILVAALPFGWNALGDALKGNTTANAAAALSCGDRADMAALAAEPQGLVLAPLRLGPRILLATDHDIVGAPYHRDNDGNRMTFETLLDAPDGAHQRIAERGVRYVALCLGDTDLPNLTAYRADSLIADLANGNAPDWLSPLPSDGPIRAWRVVN